MKHLLLWSQIFFSAVAFSAAPSPSPVPKINPNALFKKSSASSVSNSQNYEEALCGAKPTSANLASQIDKLKAVEREMPPVSDQRDVPWCYAYSACDLYDYNFHISKNPRVPYSDSNRISPIDAVGASQSITGKTVLDFNETGVTSDVLQGLKKQGSARSRSQLHMGDLSQPDPDTQKYVKELMQKYSDQSKTVSFNKTNVTACFSSANNLSDLKKDIETKLHGVLAINKVLFDAEVASNENTSDLKVFHYQQKVKPIVPSIQLPAVSTQDFLTNNLNSYLSKLKAIADEKQPATLAVCGDDLKDSGVKSADGCGTHAITFVGAGYVGGKCSVRIRNSWGEGWGENGYKTLTVDELVANLKHRMSLTGESSYQISWLSQKGSGSNRTYDEALWNTQEGITFTGTAKKKTDGRYLAVNGTIKYPGGASIEYVGGKMVRVTNFKLGNGQIYTGPVIDQNDGTFITAPK